MYIGVGTRGGGDKSQTTAIHARNGANADSGLCLETMTDGNMKLPVYN